MARKRAPGGGRKPEGTGKPANFSTRISTETREALDTEAESLGLSISKVAELMLRRGIAATRERERDPAQYALTHVLSELIDQVARTENDARKTSAWRADPYTFRVVRLAFDKILGALEPPGEIKPPTAGDVRGYAGFFMDAEGAEPETLANTAARAIWMLLNKMDDGVMISGGDRIFTAEQHRQSYSMSRAGADLQLKTGEQKS